MFNLARKNHLAMNLNKLRKQFPDNYQFFPKTWILPADRADLLAQFKDRKPKTFILKPQASCQGRGIMLAQYPEQIPDGEAMVAQRYVLKPYLLDGLKFDLRIYFLVAGCEPLRLFVFKEGMARLATNEYTAPGKGNLQNMFMHLTNYAINKFNKDFQQNDGNDAGSGHKRLMSWVFQHMKESGVDTDKLWREIKLLALKTLCVAQPQLAHNYRSGQSEDYYNHQCFEILGFDVLIDAKCRPILLEVNHTPSFSTDSTLDFDLKKQVIHDAIVLMHMTTPFKAKLIAQKKKEAGQRVITGKRVKLSVEERDQLRKQCQIERDKFIKKKLGGYEQIYPFPEGEISTEPYEEFMSFAKKEYEIQTGAVKKQAKKEELPTKAAFGTRVPYEPQSKKLIKKTNDKQIISQKSTEFTTSKSEMKGDIVKQSSDSPVLSIPKFTMAKSTAIPNLSTSEIPSVASLTNTTDNTPAEARRTTQLRLEAMKQEIIERVSNQAELKRQRALKVQVQKGLLPGQQELRQPPFSTQQTQDLGGSAIHRGVNSNITKENQNLFQVQTTQRPASSDYQGRRPRNNLTEIHNKVIQKEEMPKLGRFLKSNVATMSLNSQEDVQTKHPNSLNQLGELKDQKLGAIRLQNQQEKKVYVDNHQRFHSKDSRNIARKLPLLTTKVELVLGPPTIVAGLGLSVAGYQIPAKK